MQHDWTHRQALAEMWHIPHHSYFTLTTEARLSRDYLTINVSDQDFWRWKGQSITLLLLDQPYLNGSTIKRSTGMSHRWSQTSFYNALPSQRMPDARSQSLILQSWISSCSNALLQSCSLYPLNLGFRRRAQTHRCNLSSIAPCLRWSSSQSSVSLQGRQCSMAMSLSLTGLAGMFISHSVP